MDRLRVVELSGAPRRMGEAFGEEFREDIQNFTQSRMDHLAEFVQRHDPGRRLSREAILTAVRLTLDAHRQFDAAIWEEFCGIARAAHLALEELLVGNGYTDMRDFVLFAGAEPAAGPAGHLGECSAFLIPADRADGEPIVGQTWDMNADAAEFVRVVHRKPDDAPETLGLTTVGCLCLIGMNSEGVAVGNTNLVPTDARPGVNYLFTLTRALRCGSAEEAAAQVEAAPRLSGHNYYTADARTAINVETTAEHAHRSTVEGDVFVHTNHYLAEPLRPLELEALDLSNSEWRYETLSGNVARLSDTVRMDAAWTLLSDVTQADVQRELGGDSPRASATLAAVVQCPGRRVLYACVGGPAEGNAQVFEL